MESFTDSEGLPPRPALSTDFAVQEGGDGAGYLMQMSPLMTAEEGLFPAWLAQGGQPFLDEDGGGGIEMVPPVDEPSVMVRGDNGVSRWVTTVQRPARRVPSSVWGMRACCYDSDDEEQSLAEDFGGGIADAASHTRKGKWIVENLDSLRKEAEGLLRKQEESRTIREAKESAKGAASPHTTPATDTVKSRKGHMGGTSGIDEDDAFAGSSLLWTTRYAPKGYVDLLSEESANLSLLQWIKAWDAHVFRNRHVDEIHTDEHHKDASASGKSAKTMAEVEDEKIRKLRQGGGGGITRQKKDKPASSPTADTRPFHRIILITGPPGAGKTTMAHIIAEHCCGYAPVEINASVDRSVGGASGGASNAKNPLERTLQSAIADLQFGIKKGGAMLGTALDAMTSRPRCLILDEIDGVASVGPGGGVIGYLLKHMPDIHRPVICLANDLHAPALRELKQHGTYYLPTYYSPASPAAQQRAFFEEAFGGDSRFRKEVLILQLPVIQPQRLTARLEVILRKEEAYRARYNAEMRRRESQLGGVAQRRMLPLKAVDQPVLAQLVALSNGDVRTCLTTLQFLLLEGVAEESESTVAHTAAAYQLKRHASATNLQAAFEQVCSKDAALSLKAVWKQLFVKEDKEKYLQIMAKSEAAERRVQGETNRQLSSAGAAAVPIPPTHPPEPAASEYERALDNEARRKAAAKLKRYRQMRKEMGLLPDDEEATAVEVVTTAAPATSATGEPAVHIPMSTRERLTAELQQATWWTGKRRLPNTPGEGPAATAVPDPGFRFVMHSLFGGSRNYNAGDEDAGGDTGGGDSLVEGIHEFYLQPQPIYSDHAMRKTAHMSFSLSTLDTLWGTLRNGTSTSAVVSLHGLYDRLSIVTGATAFVNCSAPMSSANSAYTSNPQGGSVNKLPWVGKLSVMPQLQQSLRRKQSEATATAKQFTMSGSMISSRSEDVRNYWASVSPTVLALDVSPLICRCLLPPNAISFPQNFLAASMLAGTSRPVAGATAAAGAATASRWKDGKEYSTAFLKGPGLGGMSDQELFVFLAQRHARYGFTYVPTLAPPAYYTPKGGDKDEAQDPASRERWVLSPSLDDACFGGRFSSANLAAAASTPTTFANSAVSASSYAMASVRRGKGDGGGHQQGKGSANPAAAFGIMVARSDVRQTLAGEIGQQRVLLSRPQPSPSEDKGGWANKGLLEADSENVLPAFDTPLKRKIRGDDPKTKRPEEDQPPPPNPPVTRGATPLKVKRDFFGRPIVEAAAQTPPVSTTPATTSVSHTATPSKGPRKTSDHYVSVVRYMHYDGVTNGVKRAANVRDLLGE